MLRTERLILREPRASDLDATFVIYSNPACMTYWSTPPHDDPSISRELLDGRIAHWAKAKLNFQIELDGQLIGNVGNYHGTEIGFMLAEVHWRKGYLSEAMGAVIPYLWDVTDHAELTADVDPRNDASIGLLTSLGFHETHRAKDTFNICGTWVDSVYFALRRPETHPPKGDQHEPT